MENNEQIDNADDLKKSQDNLVDQELLNKISNINEFYKKFIDNEIDNKISNQDVHNENFVKFLSDSREVAYNYIEEVQSGLNKFVSDVEPEINYFKEYGDIIAMQPNYKSLKKITEAYEELKKLLPKDEEEVKWRI